LVAPCTQAISVSLQIPDLGIVTKSNLVADNQKEKIPTRNSEIWLALC